MPAKIDSQKKITITATMTEQQAYAFAQFLKRRQFDDFRRRAFDEDDALNMDIAADRIQEGLAVAGFSPR